MMAGVVSTVAGSGHEGLLNGSASSSQFKQPSGVAVDALGNIFVADFNNHCIRKISSQGEVSTLAGSGQAGFQDGPNSLAKFSGPYGVAVDREGNVLVADFENHRIRKVTPRGEVSTLAGSQPGFRDGPGSTALFQSLTGVAVDREGNVLVVDSGNHRIRKVDAQGLVSTLAGGTSGYLNGPGFQASFNNPQGLALDGEGNVLVADTGNHCIRKINAQGVASTLAGSQVGFRDGPGSTAQFRSPTGVTVDREGNALVCDRNNNRIRRVTPQGEVSTLVGSQSGFQDGPGSTALFKSPYGLALDPAGNLLVCDRLNHRIRRIAFLQGKPSQEETKEAAWRRCIRGPADSPFSGALFELIGNSPPRLCFKVPIFHCNVDPRSGEVGFSTLWAPDASIEILLAAVADLLVSPDVSPKAIKNQEAFTLWKANRLEYEVRARKEAALSWQRNLSDTALHFNALEVLLPSRLEMDRKAQHQIFAQVAQAETEVHLQQVRASRQQARLANAKHVGELVTQHAGVVGEERDAAEAEMLRSVLKHQLLHTLEDLITLENPLHNRKMEWLEQRLLELYLMESIPLPDSTSSSSSSASSVSSSFSPTSSSSSSSSFSDEPPLTTSECFNLMVTEAEEEQVRLVALIQSCLKKYELLYGRFEILKKVKFEEGKTSQADRYTPDYFIAHAKLLEPSFRSILKGLVATFNREEFPASVAGYNGSFTKLRMLSGVHARVIFGPPKSAERVRQKGDAHMNTDYLRATVVMADPLLLALFYFALLADSNFKLRQAKNKHNMTNLNQPPNLHVNFEFHGHVCEIQFILEDFFLIKSFSHKSYEIVRIGQLLGPALKEAMARVVVAGVYVTHSGTL